MKKLPFAVPAAPIIGERKKKVQVFFWQKAVCFLPPASAEGENAGALRGKYKFFADKKQPVFLSLVQQRA